MPQMYYAGIEHPLSKSTYKHVTLTYFLSDVLSKEGIVGNFCLFSLVLIQLGHKCS